MRDDGKINVSLRPVGYDKVTTARGQVLAALEAPTYGGKGELTLGDKSTPEAIWEVLPGLSKGQFKSAVGALLREGAVIITAEHMTLVPVSKREPMSKQPYNGKSPQGFKVCSYKTYLFLEL